MRRPVLIFDFGNVVAHFDYRNACETLGGRVGLAGEALLERLRGEGLAPLVQRYESGRMTAEEFSRGVCGLVELEVTHDEFAAAWSDIFTPNEPVARLIADLDRRGYRLILGSNTNDLHAAQFRRQFAETLAHFDALILSYEVGHIKPSAGFYAACVAAAGVPAGDCVFIDDLAENIAGARAAGLHGLIYRDPAGLVADLRALGVETSA